MSSVHFLPGRPHARSPSSSTCRMIASSFQTLAISLKYLSFRHMLDWLASSSFNPADYPIGPSLWFDLAPYIYTPWIARGYTNDLWRFNLVSLLSARQQSYLYETTQVTVETVRAHFNMSRIFVGGKQCPRVLDARPVSGAHLNCIQFHVLFTYKVEKHWKVS